MKKILLTISILALLFIASCSELGKKTIDVTDFNSCVEAGNPVMESYPEQCAHEGTTYTNKLSNQELCENLNGGNFIEEANECEGISKEVCESIDGTFNECASACRNNPDAQICTMQCVLVCEFE